MQFTTNPIALLDLLRACSEGRIQLPDFQRSWVWDAERVRSLIASVSQSFPIGALMTLKLKHGDEAFARRPVEGAGDVANVVPDQLLLDGQQRMTSLFQTCLRGAPVRVIMPNRRFPLCWFYLDIRKALDPTVDREDAVLVVPEDRVVREDFARRTVLDLSTSAGEHEALCFPLAQVFDWDDWQEGFADHWEERQERKEMKETFRRFKNDVLENFKTYQVPVIALGSDTSHEAVCLVFEKVNTGGKPLDAFELVTAMYAAKGFRLRDDWFGAEGSEGLRHRLHTHGRVADQTVGILANVQSTDVLQAIALLHTRTDRERARDRGVAEGDLPAVRATRQSLLDLPLDAYRAFRPAIEKGFKDAAKFLRQQGLYRVLDLPYQSQIVPLAAILAVVGDRWEHAGNKARIARWYWCGIFGELYGSATETRFARDVVEVPAWLDGGPEPVTVRDGVFRRNRLTQLRTRQSAAYKGINALLLKVGAKDFRTGQPYNVTLFFDEAVDIHHIFPQKWCRDHGIPPARYDTALNKTPLAYRTNRKIGGEAPSRYARRLEEGGGGDPALAPTMLDAHLLSHLIDPVLLRRDDFDGFLREREHRLLRAIAEATGHATAFVPGHDDADEGDVPAEIVRDADVDSGIEDSEAVQLIAAG